MEAAGRKRRRRTAAGAVGSAPPPGLTPKVVKSPVKSDDEVQRRRRSVKSSTDNTMSQVAIWIFANQEDPEGTLTYAGEVEDTHTLTPIMGKVEGNESYREAALRLVADVSNVKIENTTELKYVAPYTLDINEERDDVHDFAFMAEEADTYDSAIGTFDDVYCLGSS